MRLNPLAVAGLVLWVLGAAPALAGEYALALSASGTDPAIRHLETVEPEFDLYLWVTCSSDGVGTAVADVVSDFPPLSFEPLAGALNAGTAEDLILAVPCAQPEPPFVLGRWRLTSSAGQTTGSMCLHVKDTGQVGFWAACCGGPHLCEDIGGVHGFSVGQSTGCSAENGCQAPTAMQPITWGETKALYRARSN